MYHGPFRRLPEADTSRGGLGQLTRTVAVGDGLAGPRSRSDAADPLVVGRALESVETDDETVRTLVGHSSVVDSAATAQQQRIDEQDDRIAELEGELSALREELTALRSAVDGDGESGTATAD